MNYPKSPFERNPLVELQLFKQNNVVLDEYLPWLCETPAVTTYRVNLLKSTVCAFKEKIQRKLEKMYENPPEVYEIYNLPEILCVANAIKTNPVALELSLKEVIVDGCCGASLLRGAHLYVPGVVAMQTGTKLGEKVNVFADLSGKCKKGTNTRFESLDKLFLGIGVVHKQRHELFTPNVSSNGIAVELLSTVSGVPSLGDLSTCEALLQNIPSIVCVHVLGPQPGERVLDMCAAPGNKTTHIAELMRDHGVIVALDKTEKKCNYIKEKLLRNELKNVHVFSFDATKVFDDSVCLSDFSKPPFAANTFDRILLDAPCSALGNRPNLACTMKPKVLQSYSKLQRKLFVNAVQLLKPKGILVYSTCTITAEENEDIVTWALDKFLQLQLIDATPRFGGYGLANSSLSKENRKYVQRFGPPSMNDDNKMDTIGFFIAKFRKLY